MRAWDRTENYVNAQQRAAARSTHASLSASSQASGSWAGAPGYIRYRNAPHEVFSTSEWEHTGGELHLGVWRQLHLLPLNFKPRLLSCGCLIWLHSQAVKQGRAHHFLFELSSTNLLLTNLVEHLATSSGYKTLKCYQLFYPTRDNQTQIIYLAEE